ncbi:mitochondrial carrier domain-containing protein [Zychaea mexicana]|uniref:mitochondrial carrier domain-containing protein n=1 Tax=Zychaea mexicana TaxID=64656 RepID=UPI0022FF1B60|nr:mitochondrial carrier domain-containing protein [Zychaea mexicana]KAI9489168.1 mitochondrial carrier domain-containing protein [Zychaea mexicana]
MEHSQQNQTLTTAASQFSTSPSVVLQPQQEKQPKSNLRRQLDDLLFGSISGMVGKVVEYPFDTVKVRLQTQPLDRPYYTGPWHCLTSTVKQDGMRGLFTGMASPMVGSMIENAALFVGYRQVQRLIRNYSATAEEREAMAKMNEQDLPPLSLPQLVLAGASSGALASFVLTPVELVKCKLQFQLAEASNSTLAATSRSSTIRYSGPLHVITYTLKNQGLSGFYRGYLATLIREAGGGAFWFGVYEYVCELMLRRRNSTNKKDLSAPELMLAGGLGGAGYNFSFYPVDVIKSHMQTDQEVLAGQNTRPRSFMQTAREVYAGGGVKGFYRGCGITVARSIPTSAIIFLTYETLSEYFG